MYDDNQFRLWSVAERREAAAELRRAGAVAARLMDEGPERNYTVCNLYEHAMALDAQGIGHCLSCSTEFRYDPARFADLRPPRRCIHCRRAAAQRASW